MVSQLALSGTVTRSGSQRAFQSFDRAEEDTACKAVPVFKMPEQMAVT